MKRFINLFCLILVAVLWGVVLIWTLVDCDFWPELFAFFYFLYLLPLSVGVLAVAGVIKEIVLKLALKRKLTIMGLLSGGLGVIPLAWFICAKASLMPDSTIGVYLFGALCYLSVWAIFVLYGIAVIAEIKGLFTKDAASFADTLSLSDTTE